MLESIIVSLALALTFFGVPEVTLGGFVAGVAGQGSIGALCAYKTGEAINKTRRTSVGWIRRATLNMFRMPILSPWISLLSIDLKGRA